MNAQKKNIYNRTQHNLQKITLDIVPQSRQKTDTTQLIAEQRKLHIAKKTKCTPHSKTHSIVDRISPNILHNTKHTESTYNTTFRKKIRVV